MGQIPYLKYFRDDTPALRAAIAPPRTWNHCREMPRVGPGNRGCSCPVAIGAAAGPQCAAHTMRGARPAPEPRARVQGSTVGCEQGGVGGTSTQPAASSGMGSTGQQGGSSALLHGTGGSGGAAPCSCPCPAPGTGTRSRKPLEREGEREQLSPAAVSKTVVLSQGNVTLIIIIN